MAKREQELEEQEFYFKQEVDILVANLLSDFTNKIEKLEKQIKKLEKQIKWQQPQAKAQPQQQSLINEQEKNRPEFVDTGTGKAKLFNPNYQEFERETVNTEYGEISYHKGIVELENKIAKDLYESIPELVQVT